LKRQGQQLPLKFLRREKEQDFWNLVYYFDDYKLPFEFILPYENDVVKQDYVAFRQEQRKQVTKQDQPF